MINAIITNKYLGLVDGVLSMGFVFMVQDKAYSTNPISLVTPDETYDKSAAALSLAYIFDVAGAGSWEELTGKAVQLELDDNENITKIANIVDETRFITLSVSEPIEEEKESQD